MALVFLVVSLALIGVNALGIPDVLVHVISGSHSEVTSGDLSVKGVQVTTRPSNLTSYSEAVEIADQYLNQKLGADFVLQHFESVGVEQRPDVPNIWFVLYKYRSNGYELELSVAVDAGYLEPGSSRVRWEASRMIEKPQEIKLSAEVAEAIASERGLQGPYNATLSFHWESRRIAWMVTRGCPCNLGETIGYMIDAEDGTILQEVHNFSPQA